MFDVNDLDELLNREWIRRAWTYQEVILASNPIILCGKRTITWSCFQQGLDFLNDPVSTFHVRFMDLLRASFSYEGPRVPEPKRKADSISRKARSIQSFHTWRNMHAVWNEAYRPTYWNRRKFRKLPHTLKGQTRCSKNYYQEQCVKIARSWHFAKVIIAVTGIVAIPVIPMLLLFLCLLSERSNDFWAFWYGWRLNAWVGLMSLLFSTCFIMGLLITVYAVRIMPHTWSQGAATGESVTGLVQALRERQATKAADKAFALHGVLNSIGISSSKPNYARPLGLVYHELFLDLLRHKTSLINLLIDVGPRLQGVPSWVPDWSLLHERNWLDSKYVYSHTELYGASLPEPQMKISGEKLGLWSIMKGTVGFCSEEFPEIAVGSADSCPTATISKMTQSFSKWVEMIGESLSVQIGKDDRDITFQIYQALMGREIFPAPEEFVVFERWLNSMQNCSTNAQAATETRSIRNFFGLDNEVLHFTIRCCNHLAAKRSLFVTDDGCIGSGPLGMASGDQVALLRGVAVPMVLRRAGDQHGTYEVVGPAFLSGCMDLSEFNGSNFGHDWVSVYLI